MSVSVDEGIDVPKLSSANGSMIAFSVEFPVGGISTTEGDDGSDGGGEYDTLGKGDVDDGKSNVLEGEGDCDIVESTDGVMEEDDSKEGTEDDGEKDGVGDDAGVGELNGAGDDDERS